MNKEPINFETLVILVFTFVAILVFNSCNLTANDIYVTGKNPGTFIKEGCEFANYTPEKGVYHVDSCKNPHCTFKKQ